LQRMKHAEAVLTACLVLVVAIAAAISAEETPPATGRVIVNLHGHCSAFEGVADDGRASIETMAAVYAGAGYKSWFWTPHSSLASGKPETCGLFDAVASRFPRDISGLNVQLGLEYTVKPGPNFRTIAGYPNNNHLGFLGIRRAIPDQLPFRSAVEAAHAQAGIVVIHHPGPGPSEWEEDYWQRPDIAELADGLECYNGALCAIGRFEEAAYRAAADGGALLFAAGSTDAHEEKGPFGAATVVYANSTRWEDIERAFRSRRTVAVYGFSEVLPKSVARIGERIVGEEDVRLSIEFDIEPDSISLFAGQNLYREWKGFKTAEIRVSGQSEEAWSWTYRKGKSRGQTSAIWVVPKAESLPNFRAILDGNEFIVENTGSVSGTCTINFLSAPSGCGGRELGTRSLEIASGSRIKLPDVPEGTACVVCNSGGYDLDSVTRPARESDYRDNAAWRIGK